MYLIIGIKNLQLRHVIDHFSKEITTVLSFFIVNELEHDLAVFSKTYLEDNQLLSWEQHHEIVFYYRHHVSNRGQVEFLEDYVSPCAHHLCGVEEGVIMANEHITIGGLKHCGCWNAAHFRRNRKNLRLHWIINDICIWPLLFNWILLRSKWQGQGEYESN